MTSTEPAGHKAAVAAPLPTHGFVPDPAFKRVSISKPKLDCTDVGLDDSKELWLLQLPYDFPVNSSVSWQVEADGADGIKAHCKAKGAEYVMLPYEQIKPTDLFATPADPHGALLPITKRWTVARKTDAPQFCFGHDAADVDATIIAPPITALPPADKGDADKKKQELQEEQPAPVAEPLPEPRGGAVAAAPSKTNQTAPGGGGGASGAAPATQQQHQQQQGVKQEDSGAQPSGKQKSSGKKHKKRKAEAAEAPAAGEAEVKQEAHDGPAGEQQAGSKSEKKKDKKHKKDRSDNKGKEEKSSKKEKKEQKKKQ